MFFFEQVIYEDFLLNLCVIRDYIEKRGEKFLEICKVEICYVLEEICYLFCDILMEIVKNSNDCVD